VESAWLKMVRTSLHPGMHEVEDLASHPSMSKRVTALRNLARDLGLATESPESDSTLPPVIGQTGSVTGE
jgi:hypothetical protein